MPMCHPGREVPGQGIIPQRLLFEEGWGEVWHAAHNRLGAVFFVAYTTPPGVEMFNQAKAKLERWKASGGVAAEGVLPVLEVIAESAVPYLIVRGVAGRSLREVLADQETYPDPEEAVELTARLMKTLREASAMELLPFGVTLDTIIEDPACAGFPWRLLPVAPTARSQPQLLGRGLYIPQEAAIDYGSPNSDVCSLCWILAECVAGAPFQGRDIPALESAVNMPALAALLKNGITSSVGKFPDTAVIERAIRQWQRDDAPAELKKHRKARKGDKRQPREPLAKPPAPTAKGKKTAKKGGGVNAATGAKFFLETIGAILFAFLKLGLVLGVIAGLLYGGKFLLKPSYSPNTPQGAANLFCQAVIAADKSKAMSFIVGEAVADAPMVYEYFQTKAGKSSSAVLERAGTDFIGVAEIRDADDKLCGVIHLKMIPDGDVYVISQIDVTAGETLNFIGIK